MNEARYAVYWAPEPDHPLWAAGCRWLGRDPAAPGPVHDPVVHQARPRTPHTDAPAHYGFHATLKPPMRLAEGWRPGDLLRAVQALARCHAPFEMPPLALDWLGPFLAVRPAVPLGPSHPLWRLADACVAGLDEFRRLPDAAERSRREAAMLDAEQRVLLARWGYPHVLQRWRFHMTLSDPMVARDAPEARALRQAARQAFGPVLAADAPPLLAQSVCVYRQWRPGQPFRLTHRFRLGA